MGVSQEEALRRLQVQGEIGGLGAALEREETDTFSGLWLQHKPEFAVIAAFTRDGERTIRPYLEGKSYAGLVEVRTYPYTLIELKDAQRQAIEAAQSLGIPITSGISVQDNRVTVSVGNPELFREEVQRAGLELPEMVEIEASDPGSLTGTLRGEVVFYPGPGDSEIVFPIQAPTNVYMEALLTGTLVLDPNGCLRVQSEGGQSHLVLWRYGFSLRFEGENLEVLDEAGRVVGRAGEAVRMGGGESSPETVPGLPVETCPGPFWALGEIEPVEAKPE